ncbi:hypothetical protein PG989_006612 [Apiospora arundinis]
MLKKGRGLFGRPVPAPAEVVQIVHGVIGLLLCCQASKTLRVEAEHVFGGQAKTQRCVLGQKSLEWLHGVAGSVVGLACVCETPDDVSDSIAMEMGQELLDTELEDHIQAGVVGFQQDDDTVQVGESVQSAQYLRHVDFVEIFAPGIANSRSVNQAYQPVADLQTVDGGRLSGRLSSRSILLLLILPNLDVAFHKAISGIVFVEVLYGEGARNGIFELLVVHRIVQRVEHHVVVERIDKRAFANARFAKNQYVHIFVGAQRNELRLELLAVPLDELFAMSFSIALPAGV